MCACLSRSTNSSSPTNTNPCHRLFGSLLPVVSEKGKGHFLLALLHLPQQPPSSPFLLPSPPLPRPPSKSHFHAPKQTKNGSNLTLSSPAPPPPFLFFKKYTLTIHPPSPPPPPPPCLPYSLRSMYRPPSLPPSFPLSLLLLLLLKVLRTPDPGGAHPTSHPHRRHQASTVPCPCV